MLKPLAYCLIGTISAVTVSYASSADASSLLAGTVWEEVAAQAQCTLDPLLLYSVALVESRRAAGSHSTGMIRPHQYALRNSVSGSVYPETHEQAVQMLHRFAEEDRLTDVGAMQINLRWNGSRVGDITELLDLRQNVKTGADILCESLRAYPTDIRMGIGGYHTRNPDRSDDARNYGEMVLHIWRKLGELT